MIFRYSEPSDSALVIQLNDLKVAQPNLKSIALLGGWDDMQQKLYQNLTAESRQKFVNNTIEFAERWNFDGIGIVWDFVDDTIPDNAREQSGALVEEFRNSIDAECFWKNLTECRELIYLTFYDYRSLKAAYDVRVFAE